MNPEKTAKELVHWMKEQVQNAGAKGVVLGISGGVDSAVVAALGKQAFPEDCLGIMMPCGNINTDLEHSRLLVETFHIENLLVDLQSPFADLLELMYPYTEKASSEAEKAARSNIKPRLRMTVLYYFGQARGYLVLGTSNKSERTVGYFTKHGDGGADLLPLADLSKKEVYELAAYLQIPEVICQKAPSAGLWEGQTDEQDMGFTYQQLEEYLTTGTTDEAVLGKIRRMEQNSAHKRTLPPIAWIHHEG